MHVCLNCQQVIFSWGGHRPKLLAGFTESSPLGNECAKERGKAKRAKGEGWRGEKEEGRGKEREGHKMLWA